MSRLPGIWAARTGADFWRRFSASPMISNLRSTADRNSSSARKSSRVRPAMMRARKLPAWRISSKDLRGSCVIKHLPALVDPLAKIGIPNGGVHNQIDSPLEQVFEGMEQLEVIRGDAPFLHRLE